MKKKSLCLGMCVTALGLLSLTGCGGKSQSSFDADAALKSLLNDVSYAGQLTDVSDNAQFYFSDLPDGTQVQMYAMQGTSADQVILFEAGQEQDTAAIEGAVDTYLDSLKEQANNYTPEEIPKIEDAIIYKNGTYVIVCITEDADTAKGLLP